MVARIRSGKSLKGAINYNENKVKEGNADLILAKGYAKDINQLNFYDKLNRLQKLADLNTRAATHCVHISLNFDMTENLSVDKLQQIAETYMQKIGFDNQPFLVYHHYDAAHQHVHIVSTNIQKDGKRISLHNLGRNESEKARQEIEGSFGLVKAGGKKQSEGQSLKPINLEKATYGKSETKRAISNIVTVVVSQYRFASLAELNAVLKQFNVIADRGAEKTRMFEKKGLVYFLLDNGGNKTGVPIKASTIPGKPILNALEGKFDSNKELGKAFRQQLKDTIDKMLKDAGSSSHFSELLKAQHIDVVYRTNDDGFVYGITYVDHRTKSVFNGSDLGKQYSAAAIRQQWAGEACQVQEKKQEGVSAPISIQSTKVIAESQPIDKDLLQVVMDADGSYDYLPHQLKKKRKRKRKKRI